MKRKQGWDRRGFSVIEALAAVTLLAIAMAPIYLMLQQMSDAALRAERLVEARSVLDTVQALITSGEQAPANIQGWTVTVMDEQIEHEGRVDGYVGGRYFTAALIRTEVEISKQGFVLQRSMIRLELDPIYETPDEALFSNF